MTLLNAWWENGGERRARERWAFVQCDRCQPPHLELGSAARLRVVGWGFEELEGRHHLCPSCNRSVLARPRARMWPPERNPALPNVIVIGAAKCGTTSMHRYLSLHPDIHVPHNKEMSFFQDPDCLDKLDLYSTFFDGDAPVRGEASVRYTYHPLLPGVPERMRTAIPDARLIYLVRDPVERAISHFVEQASYGHDVKDRLGRFEDPYDLSIAAGRYATQLERYTRLFATDQILVVDQADLLARRRETLRAVFQFLGVDAEFWTPEFERLDNTRVTKRRRTGLYRSLATHRLAAAVRRRVPPRARAAVLAPVKRAALRRVEPPVVDHALRDRLRDEFGDEVARLREMTGQEFASWQI